MQEEDKILNKRIDKIINWFKDPYNLTLFGIILFAFGIRVYYFFLTINQPLWWDEAEYMLKAKNIAFGTPETGWAGYLRPIAFSFFSSAIFKMGLGEIPLRFLWIIISVLNIYLIYLIGNSLFNKKVGLISSFLFSILYLDLFYSMRLLVDVPQVFFINLAAYFFIKVYFKRSSKKLIYLIFPVILFGTLFRFTIGLFLFIFLTYLILTTGIKFLKEKEWYYSILFGIVTFLPYMIYSQIKFGNPLQAILFVLFSGEGQRAENPVSVFMQYIFYLPNYYSIIIFIFFIIGFFTLFLRMILTWDIIFKEEKNKKNLFLLLWIVIPLIFFGLYINHFEDRYIFMIFPAFSIISSLALINFYEFIKKYQKYLGILFLVIILSVSCYQEINRSDKLILSKIDTYKDFKDVGNYIKTNSNLTDIIFSSGVPQTTYYSERTTYQYPSSSDIFNKNLSFLKPKFMIVSIWEKSPDWVYVWPQENQEILEIVKVYYLDESQLSTVVYRFKEYPIIT